jgi:hypothetical protein
MLEMYRNGEYKGLGLMLLESTKPLLTDHRIIKALQYIDSDNNFGVIMKLLCIEKETMEYGIDLIY